MDDIIINMKRIGTFGAVAGGILGLVMFAAWGAATLLGVNGDSFILWAMAIVAISAGIFLPVLAIGCLLEELF